MPATVALYNHPWSSLGFYNINANSLEDDEFEQTDMASRNGAAGLLLSVNHLLSYYSYNVLLIQYLYVDASAITDIMASLIHNNPSARDAACILSTLHLTTMRGSNMD